MFVRSKSMRMNTKSRMFIISAGVVLSITGIAKIWSSLGQGRILVVPDPLTGIELGHLLFLVGAAEIVLALGCFNCKRQLLSVAAIAWLATSVVAYRLGLLWMGWHRPCSCLGNLTDAIHVSPQVADHVMRCVLAYLLIGSYGILFAQGLKRKDY
jgi:hypothetical protein